MNNMEYVVILMKNVNTKNAIHGQIVHSAVVENTVLILKMKSTVDADDGSDHLHSETIKKVYALGTLMGYYDMEALDAETLAKDLGYDIKDLQFMDTI